ncbi:MAG TPA: hypothetical protein VGJ04_12655 [Pirellulales bacterium]|jgi:hypothetical protein
MQDSIIQHIELFSGAASPAAARVYAAITVDKTHQFDSKQFKLRGHLIGPQCEFAHTLSARIPLADRGSDETLLAEAIVPDPCFWTPELPFLYRAELELVDGASVVLRYDGNVGIRRLGSRGRELYFEGKRFVLRGANCHFNEGVPTGDELAYMRETWTAAIVSWPSDALCQLASRSGILLIADLRASQVNVSQHHAAERVRGVAQWPAVAMAIVDAETIPLVEFRGGVRNLLIGQYVRATESTPVAEQAQIVFAEVGEPSDFAHQLVQYNRPVIAVRRLEQLTTIEASRAACDALQRDLAMAGDFAGYVV